jgi:hypothetical protein
MRLSRAAGTFVGALILDRYGHVDAAMRKGATADCRKANAPPKLHASESLPVN